MEQNQIIINEKKREQPESIPVPNSVEELEKEIEANYNPIDGLSLEDYRQIAKYFANWQREQMMQGALDGEIGFREGDSIGLNQSERLQLFVSHNDLERIGLKYDDEVKVLIFKKG